MKKTILTMATAVGFIAFANAQQTTATTDAVGYNTVTCLPNSDTIVSVPFLNTTDSISSTVDGSISSNGDEATFTINGVSNLTADQYKTLYYVRFTSGNMEGNIYQITGNTASTVTFDTLGDPVTAANGDKFTIYKFWTLGTLFPPATQETIVESAGNLAFQRRTQVLLRVNVPDGTDIAPNKGYFLKSTGWVSNADFSDANDTILWPDSFFIVRHNSQVTSSTTYRPVGTVDAHSSFVIPLSTNATGSQDNYVAIPRPVTVKLSELNLFDSGAFVASAGNLAFQRRDQLFVYDNGLAGKDEAGSAIYFHNGTNWVRNSDLQNADLDEIEPSQGIVIRKYQTANGGTVFWENTPSY